MIYSDFFSHTFDERIKPREPAEDEYIKDGRIYCRSCNTPRDFLMPDYGGSGETRLFYTGRCKCRETAYSEAEREELKAGAERARAMLTLPSYRAYRFSNDDGKSPETTIAAKEYVGKFAQLAPEGKGLLLYGGIGTGKTYYAMCIGNALIDKYYPLYRYCFVRNTTFADIIQTAFDFEEGEGRLKSLTHAKALIIDDLGTERGKSYFQEKSNTTSFAEERLYKFMNEIYERRIAMIITTNLALEEFNTAATDKTNLTYARIFDRIMERCEPIKVNAVRRRQKEDNR